MEVLIASKLLGVPPARQLFGDADALGRRLRHEMTLPPGEPGEREIVGVVGDVRHFGPGEAPEPQLYVPHAQSAWPSMHLLVRAAGSTATLAPAVRAAVRELDPGILLPPFESLADVTASALARPRLQTALVAIFAATARWTWYSRSRRRPDPYVAGKSLPAA